TNIIPPLIPTLFPLIFPPTPIIIPLTPLILITIILKLKIQHTISIPLLTLIPILQSPPHDFLIFPLITTTTLILPLLSSFILNLLFFPPNYQTNLIRNTLENTEEIMKSIRL
ncbi:aromatic acid exporter family protein, partial [Bacillus subtilis]|uniref:aromatic acid exporter family protein n=1 Tax=Bacillus subtilis TaxID=1423 RepID=UPI00338E5924